MSLIISGHGNPTRVCSVKHNSSVWSELVDLKEKIYIIYRGANLSPFGEIRRFHLEIGHSRESYRSVKKKKNWGGGGGVSSLDLRFIYVMSPAAFFSPVGNGRMDPPYSVSDWLTLGSAGCLVFSLCPRKVSVNSLHRHVNKTTWISANTRLKYMRNICIESLTCLLLNEVSHVQNKYSMLK